MIYIVLLLAAILRFWGITTGLPQLLLPDETEIVLQGLKMAGQFGKPDIFYYGTVFQTLLAIIFGFTYFIGKIFGNFKSGQDFLVYFFNDPSIILLSSRILAASFGVLAVCLVYVIGKKIFNKRIGLLAALFLAIASPHVKESHIAKGDVLAGIFVLLIFYQATKILLTGKLRHYILAGLFLGLGFTTKYYPLLAVPLVFAAHILRKKILTNKTIFLSIDSNLVYLFITFFITVFISSPYLFFIPLNTLKSEWELITNSTKYIERGGFTNSYSYFLTAKTFLTYHFYQAFGPHIYFLAIVGIFPTLHRFKKIGILLILHPVFFLLTVDLWLKMNIDRYSMQILPFVAILAAITIDTIFLKKDRYGITKVFVVSLIIFLIYIPLVRTIKVDVLLSSADTRVLATKFIEQNITIGSKIAVEGSFTLVHNAMWGPTLYPTPQSIENFLTQTGIISPILQAKLIVSKQKPTYDLLTPFVSIGLTNIQENNNKESSKDNKLKDTGIYKEDNIQYLVTNSWMQEMNPISPEFLKSMQQNYTQISSFIPTIDFEKDFFGLPLNYTSIDQMPLFGIKESHVFGPKITIYRLIPAQLKNDINKNSF